MLIKTYEKQLKGKSIQEIRNEKLIRDGELIGGNELASLIRGKTDGKVSPKVLPITGFKVGEDPIMFATNIITKQNEEIKSPEFPPPPPPPRGLMLLGIELGLPKPPIFCP